MPIGHSTLHVGLLRDEIPEQVRHEGSLDWGSGKDRIALPGARLVHVHTSQQESLHATIRCLPTGRPVQTHRMDLRDLDAEWIASRCRSSTGFMKRVRAQKQVSARRQRNQQSRAQRVRVRTKTKGNKRKLCGPTGGVSRAWLSQRFRRQTGRPKWSALAAEYKNPRAQDPSKVAARDAAALASGHRLIGVLAV